MKPSEYPEITDTKAWLAEVRELIEEADDAALEVGITNTVSRQLMLADIERANDRRRADELLKFLGIYGELVCELALKDRTSEQRKEVPNTATDAKLDDEAPLVRSQDELENMQSLASRIREKTGVKDLNELADREDRADISAEAERIALRRTLN